MELFGVGIPEIGLIMLIALVIVGPQRFPEVARQLAHWIRTARAFTDAVMKDVRSAVDEIEQEVTAANDGVNPIRELEDLRKELGTAAQDANATVADAATLPPVAPVNDEWAAVTETRDTDAVIEPEPEPAAATEGAPPAATIPEVTPEPAAEPEPEPAAATRAEPTPPEQRRADA
ncbi:MAG: twin-arginine translocase TatA/TatE family subunit [Dehalococcoidia bacterium]